MLVLERRLLMNKHPTMHVASSRVVGVPSRMPVVTNWDYIVLLPRVGSRYKSCLLRGDLEQLGLQVL